MLVDLKRTDMHKWVQHSGPGRSFVILKSHQHKSKSSALLKVLKRTPASLDIFGFYIFNSIAPPPRSLYPLHNSHASESQTSKWRRDFRAGTFANEWIDAVGVCAWNIMRENMGKDRIPSPEDHLSCCTCSPASTIKDGAAPASLVPTRVTKQSTVNSYCATERRPYVDCWDGHTQINWLHK